MSEGGKVGGGERSRGGIGERSRVDGGEEVESRETSEIVNVELAYEAVDL